MHVRWVDDAFIRKYPEITRRVVKTLVVAAKWISDKESAPQPVFQLWTKSGVPFANFKEDFKGQSLKLLSSPLIDGYITDQYKQQIAGAKKFGLIKESFDFTPWVDTSFLNQALKELGLESYWEPLGASGKSTRVAAADPAAGCSTRRGDRLTALSVLTGARGFFDSSARARRPRS